MDLKYTLNLSNLDNNFRGVDIFHILCILILTLCLFFLLPQKVFAENMDEKENQPSVSAAKEENIVKEPQNLYAKAACLLDAESGRVLYDKNGNQKLPMASTTKIMTCIITLEQADLEDIVTISKYASTMPDVQLNVTAGEQYVLKDLLYSLMLESHNDVAVAIAEHVGGSVEGFATMMNDKAIELGCSHTHFVTPNGLDSEEHYTTAIELAKIAAYAIKNKTFLEIVNTPSHQFSEVNGKRTCSVNNKDAFLHIYQGAIGIKTGFTGKAGYCFVGAVQKDNSTLISSVLASGWPPNKTYKWKDTMKLMDYGFSYFHPRQIVNKEKLFPEIPVRAGKENAVSLYYQGEISLLLREDEQVTILYRLPNELKAPIEKDTAVGSAEYYVGGTHYTSIPIYAKTAVEAVDYQFCLNKIISLWLP